MEECVFSFFPISFSIEFPYTLDSFSTSFDKIFSIRLIDCEKISNSLKEVVNKLINIVDRQKKNGLFCSNLSSEELKNIDKKQ